MARSGRIRPARRPPGWVAPGPPPRPAPDLVPRPGEDLCHLAGDWRIFQRVRGHRWSLDDLVTAWFAAETTPAPGTIVDLGCGIGSVLLLLAWRFPAARLVGIEAQAESVELARRSIAWNGVGTRVRVIAGDLRDPAVLAGEGRCDLVTGTPPYLPPRTATSPRTAQADACRLERRGGVEAYCSAARRLLASHGRFVVCAAHAQTARVRAAADAAALVIERARAVVPRAGKPPLFSVYALRRAEDGPVTPVAPPPLTVAAMPPLIVRDGTGARTAEFRALRARMGMPP